MAAGQAAAGQGDAGQAQQGEAQAQGGADYAAMARQLEAHSSGLEESRQMMSQILQAVQGPQEPPADTGQQTDDGMDLSFLGDDQGYDPAAAAQQLQSAMAREIDSRLKPLQEQYDNRIGEIERENQANALVAEFPDIAETETSQRVVKLAAEFAEQLGQPDLANNPKMWRIAYMVGRAAEAANSEGAEPSSAAHLEGGAGATPAGSQVSLDDVRASIVNGGGARGASVLPFG